MPIRQSQYFNDPNIGQAFSNLSGLFAPPDGTDLAGYATAAAKKAEAQRLAGLYDYSQRPDFNQTQFDRMNMAAGNWNPTQSFYAQDQNNGTAMRGQDIVASTSRANNADDNAEKMKEREMLDAVLRANNADDNTRQMAQQELINKQSGLNNIADNQTKLTQTNMEGRFAGDRNAANNVASGQRQNSINDTVLTKANLDNSNALTLEMVKPKAAGTTTILPPKIAEMYNVPQTQLGAITAAPGERVTTANGVIVGADKPLTKTEWDAQQAERLRAGGQLSDQQILDTINGAQTPVKAVVDGKNVYMTPGEAVRTNAQPLINEGASAKPENATAIYPDGRRVPVVQRSTDNKWIAAQTGEVIGPDAQVVEMAKPTGGNDMLGLPGVTTANVTAGHTLNASLDATEMTIDSMLDTLRKNPNAAGFTARIKGVAQSVVSSAQQVVKAYAADNPTATVTLKEAQSLMGGVGDSYDPDVVKMRSMTLNLAYSLAQTNNPGTEVSRQALDRQMEALGQSWFDSQQDFVTSLESIKKNLIPIGRKRAADLLGQQTGVPAPTGGATTGSATIGPKEGDTATNPKTGQKAVFTNGAWVVK